ncbi:MAG: hypothetical protein WC629_02725 [Candidatus Paceibacterota bacterium]|jgi:hypothetical protein
MNITTQTLAPFIGGQLEVINPTDGYHYRGEIKTAEVGADGTLAVKFKWTAREIGFMTRKWVKETTHTTYKASRKIFSSARFILGRKDGDKILSMKPKSKRFDDTLIFSLPEGKGLDPAKVQGLELAELCLVE